MPETVVEAPTLRHEPLKRPRNHPLFRVVELQPSRAVASAEPNSEFRAWIKIRIRLSILDLQVCTVRKFANSKSLKEKET